MIETGKTGLTANRKTARKTRKRRKQKTEVLPLRYGQRQVLVDFLNHDFSKPLKYDRERGYIDTNGRQVSGELHMMIHRDLSLGSVGHLEGIRQRVLTDLLPIAEPPLGFARERMQDYLDSLTAKLNQRRFEPVFKVWAGEEKRLLTRDQRVFSRGSGKWIITMDFSAGISYSPERDFYGMIAEGLINGQLDLLRRCPYSDCQKFFTARERRQVFCIPEHGRLYYDKSERATQRVYKSREND